MSNAADKKFADLFDPDDPELRRIANEKPRAPRDGRATSASLDLHGFTREEAAIKIEAFIQRCRGKGVNRARIITGVGKHSKDGPVLKDRAEKVLRRLRQQGLVASVTWEGRKKQSGALLVRID